MEFNVGVILAPNDFSYYLNISQFDDYVQFKAYKIESYWDEGDRHNRTNLPLVPCKVEDFYEPYGPLRDVFNVAIPYA